MVQTIVHKVRILPIEVNRMSYTDRLSSKECTGYMQGHRTLDSRAEGRSVSLLSEPLNQVNEDICKILSSKCTLTSGYLDFLLQPVLRRLAGQYKVHFTDRCCAEDPLVVQVRSAHY